jgi:hypothetical protein
VSVQSSNLRACSVGGLYPRTRIIHRRFYGGAHYDTLSSPEVLINIKLGRTYAVEFKLCGFATD